MTDIAKMKQCVTELLAAMSTIAVHARSLDDARIIAAVAVMIVNVVAVEGRIPSENERLKWANQLIEPLRDDCSDAALVANANALDVAVRSADEIIKACERAVLPRIIGTEEHEMLLKLKGTIALKGKL